MSTCATLFEACGFIFETTTRLVLCVHLLTCKKYLVLIHFLSHLFCSIHSPFASILRVRRCLDAAFVADTTCPDGHIVTYGKPVSPCSFFSRSVLSFLFLCQCCSSLLLVHQGMDCREHRHQEMEAREVGPSGRLPSTAGRIEHSRGCFWRTGAFIGIVKLSF